MAVQVTLARAVRLTCLALAATAILVVGAGTTAAIGPGVAIVSTEVHNDDEVAVTSITVGSIVHPSFVVSGASGTPTGQITVLKWNNGTCAGTHAYAYGGVLSNGRLDAYFLDDTSNDATTISYRGDYHGDAVYGAVQGGCTSLTFTRATPSVVLKLHDVDHDVVTSVPVTTHVHAYVEVSGRVDGPIGSVRVRQWPNGTCTGFSSLVGPYALSGGVVDTPFQWALNTAGTVSFRAQYLGDTTYFAADSPCVVVTVNKFTTTLTAQVHNAAHDSVDSVLVGETIHAAFHLSASIGTPSGSVSVRRWNSLGCPGAAALTELVPVAAVVDPASFLETVNHPSTESWQVVYPGSDLYASASSPCMNLTWQALPTVAVVIHDAGHNAVTTVPAGTPVHLQVTVAGAFATPTGQVTLRYHTNGTCSSAVAFGTVTLSSGVAHDATLTYKPGAAGTYSFSAAYKGDTAYVPKTNGCVVLHVTAPIATPTATPKSTPKPTLAPQPTASAGATSVPGASQAPVSSGAASPAPGATDGPSPGATPGPSLGAPGASGASGPPGSTGGSEPGATNSTGGPGVDPSAASGGGFVGLFLLLLAVVLGGLFLVWASRRNSRARPG